MKSSLSTSCGLSDAVNEFTNHQVFDPRERLGGLPGRSGYDHGKSSRRSTMPYRSRCDAAFSFMVLNLPHKSAVMPLASG